MLIRLIEVKDELGMAAALSSPICMEDQAIYMTCSSHIARTLARQKLPCIFVEENQEDVYGVDMIVAKEDEDWKQDHPFLERIWRRHYQMPWIIAETQRLLIRESTLEDLSAFLSMYEEEKDNPDVKPFLGEPEKELGAYIQNCYGIYGYGLWTLIKKEDGQVIGRIGFEPAHAGNSEMLGTSEMPGNSEMPGTSEMPETSEMPGTSETCPAPYLGYLIRKAYRHQGYAREAARAVLSYGKKELGFETVALATSQSNKGSRKLADQLGFLMVGENNDSHIRYRLDL